MTEVTTRISIIVLSANEEHLNKDYFLEFLIGTNLLPENVPIHFNVDMLAASFKDPQGRDCYSLGGVGEMQAVGMKVVDDPGQVFLVVVDDSPGQAMAEYQAAGLQQHFDIQQVDLLGVFTTKNRGLVLSTYVLRDIEHMDALNQTLLPSKETLH